MLRCNTLRLSRTHLHDATSPRDAARRPGHPSPPHATTPPAVHNKQIDPCAMLHATLHAMSQCNKHDGQPQDLFGSALQHVRPRTFATPPPVSTYAARATPTHTPHANGQILEQWPCIRTDISMRLHCMARRCAWSPSLVRFPDHPSARPASPPPRVWRRCTPHRTLAPHCAAQQHLQS